MMNRFSVFSTLVLSAMASLYGQGLVPVLYETDTEWLIDMPAGEFGYGSQMSIVDKSTGIVRYYDDYSFEGEPIYEPYWSTSSGRLPTDISTLGLLVGGYINELIVAQPFENKVSIYGPTGYLSNSDIYFDGVGPSAGLSFPAVPEQGQFDPVLMVQTSLNSPPATVAHGLLFSSGLGAPYDVPDADVFVNFERSLTFPAQVDVSFDGSNAVVAVVSGSKVFLAQPQLDDLKLNNEQPFPVGGQVIYGDFLRTDVVNQLLAFSPGEASLYVYSLSESGGNWTLLAPIEFDLGMPIQMASRIVLEGKLMVAVHYAGTGQIDLIDLAAEEVVQQLQISDPGSVTAVMAMNGDRIMAFTGEKGISSRYELFGDDGAGALKSLFTGDLPEDGFNEALETERANVFFFDDSPLTNQEANLLGWFDGGSGVDWASDSSIQYSSVVYQAWNDGGVATGLQQTFQSSRLLPSGTNVTLPNQINNYASLVGLGLSGSSDALLLTSWTPSPGNLDELSSISAEFPEGTSLYYRMEASEAWQAYSGPFYPSSDSFEIIYYLETSTGQKGPIETVSYAFALSAFNRDSNGDGVPDFVQAATGLDPFGSGDSDGDTVSDLDELIAGTSASDAEDTPSFDSVIDRGIYQDFELIARNIDGFVWEVGSVGYIDRLTGVRLGQGVVETGDLLAKLTAIPVVYPEALLAVSSQARFFCEGDDLNTPTGFESLLLIGNEPFDLLDFEADYTGGSVSDAASAWLAALSSQVSGEREIRSETLDELATALSLAFEYALEDEFKDLGYLAEVDQLTLFPNRPGDARWMSISEIIAEQDGANGEARFGLADLMGDLLLYESLQSAKVSVASWTEWPAFCSYVYGLFTSAQVPHTIGRSPVDVLRSLLRDQDLPDDLVDALGLDLSAVAVPLSEAYVLRGNDFVRETVDTYELTVVDADTEGCFQAVNLLNQEFALFDALGERFVSSKAVDLLPGTTIRIGAVVRDDFDACLGTALEVRSFAVDRLPDLETADANGNLLDDNWELYWLGAGDFDPFSSVDGSDYTLLQQFLSGSDPTDPSQLPDAPVRDLGVPKIAINVTGANEVTLTWDWPGEYSDLIRFKLIESDSLGNLSAIDPVSVSYDRSGDAHTLVIVVPSTDKRFFRLALSID